jgi:hypothetical protein
MGCERTSKIAEEEKYMEYLITGRPWRSRAREGLCKCAFLRPSTRSMRRSSLSTRISRRPRKEWSLWLECESLLCLPSETNLTGTSASGLPPRAPARGTIGARLRLLLGLGGCGQTTAEGQQELGESIRRGGTWRRDGSEG